MKFTVHETGVQPHMTSWIPESRIFNYTFTDVKNNPLPDMDVTSDISKTMRDNTFMWPKNWQDSAIRLNGTIPGAGPKKSNLRCFPPPPTTSANNNNNNNNINNNGSNNSNSAAVGGVLENVKYACYASKLAAFKSPNSADSSVEKRFVPMASQFYMTDVMITPAPGALCSNLEVYRIVLDAESNVEHGLDYPASTATPTSYSSTMMPYYCGLFSDSEWCLHFQHTFSPQDYAKRIATKCAEGNGNLIFRLPIRSADVDPSTGQIGLDTLLVTNGANVQLKFSWHYQGETPPFFSTWDDKSKLEDCIQDWRDSSESAQVFFKFAIMITPLLVVWYFLAVQFEILIENSQVSVLCIFVLLPSILIFLSVGAWLPMSGSIICAIAIHHSPHTDLQKVSTWRIMVRPVLFFITAACNSIQFAWIMALIGQAGCSAFLYENTIHQLSKISSDFIISDQPSPTWIGLTMPSILVINVAFLLGSAVCIVLETLQTWGKPK